MADTVDHKNCPYSSIDSDSYWSLSEAEYPDLFAHSKSELHINESIKVATAGSCFAQYITKELKANGFNFLNTEPGSALLNAEEKKRLNYGVFSARFGNIYNTLQLLQLIKSAKGEWGTSEPSWHQNNACYDPLRPFILPYGFSDERSLLSDRKSHLDAVLRMFKELDVLVFTLGLTEVWRSKKDGTVFPSCPGCPIGEFDPDKYEFINLSVTQVVDSLREFMTELSAINPNASVILTVSPVPLAATYTGRHVVEANTYSKSVLRVAAEETQRQYENIHYFPSYEIITGSHQVEYFEKDFRTISPLGVAHVMRAFFGMYTDIQLENMQEEKIKKSEPHTSEADNSSLDDKGDTVICDEDKLFEMMATKPAS